MVVIEEETIQKGSKVLLLKLNATGKPGVGFWKMETKYKYFLVAKQTYVNYTLITRMVPDVKNENLTSTSNCQMKFKFNHCPYRPHASRFSNMYKLH